MRILFESDDQTDFFWRFVLGTVGLLVRVGRRVKTKMLECLTTGAEVGFADGGAVGVTVGTSVGRFEGVRVGASALNGFFVGL